MPPVMMGAGSGGGAAANVAYDNQGEVENDTNPTTPLSTASFTVAVGAVGLVGYYSNIQLTGVTITIAGQTATAIEIFDSGRGGLYGAVGLASGSQVATIAWTGGTPNYIALNAITFTGAGDTFGTAFTNEANDAWSSEASKVLAITSASGDLTASALVTYSNITDIATDQTLKYIGSKAEFRLAMDIGPGTGTTTHTWTFASQWSGGVGINVKKK